MHKQTIEENEDTREANTKAKANECSIPIMQNRISKSNDDAMTVNPCRALLDYAKLLYEYLIPNAQLINRMNPVN